MGSSLGFQLLLLLLTAFLFFSPSFSSTSSTSTSVVDTNSKVIIQPTKLINSICNQTTNYKYCVDVLYTDPRASNADQILLAYISFGLSYTNATNTQAYIKDLVKNVAVKNNNYVLEKRLKRCILDYEKAVSALEEAYNNLNSETYFDLGKLASVCVHAAVDCQRTFKPRHSPLTKRNKDLRQLCTISSVISTFFT